MKILYGTSNPAKLKAMKGYLAGLDIELIGLNDVSGDVPDVPEVGSTPLENAIIKAKAYYQVYKMPVFSCDSGLFFENLEEFSPGVHVRNVNGKHLSDDEMIEYYGGLAKRHGDIIAQYRNAICLVLDDEHIYTEMADDMHGDKFIMTSAPHPKRVKGFPLDSLSKNISDGEYCYDSYRPPKNNRPGFKEFFMNVLGLHAHSFVIETERLILRPLTVLDAEAVFEWVSDERVSKYMVYNTYGSIEQVKAWLKHVEKDTYTYNFGFVRKSDGMLIGSGDIGPDKRYGYWSFGYNLRHDCWGNGYATEAAKAMIRFAAKHFDVKKFCASYCEPNTASGRVMRKCGLHFTGYGEFKKLDGSCPMRSIECEGDISDMDFIKT